MQIGDRVRCIESNIEVVEGVYYTVIDIEGRLCSLDGCRYQHFTRRFVVENEPEGLEEPEAPAPRPYQVGDRVRFTNVCPRGWWFGPHTQYKEGVISSVDRDGPYSMEVRVEGFGRDGSVNEEHVELILEAEEVQPEQEQNKATIERFVIIFHNPNLNKISTEIKASERAAQEFIRLLGRHATVLKTTKVKFEIPLDGLPEGVRW